MLADTIPVSASYEWANVGLYPYPMDIHRMSQKPANLGEAGGTLWHLNGDLYALSLCGTQCTGASIASALYWMAINGMVVLAHSLKSELTIQVPF